MDDDDVAVNIVGYGGALVLVLVLKKSGAAGELPWSAMWLFLLPTCHS